MNLFARWRWILVLGALLATGALLPPDGKVPTQPVAALDKPRPARTDGPKPEPMIQEIRRTAFGRGGDAFEIRNWTPPPASPVEPAVPTAPPVPFIFLGKKYEDDAWLVFLGLQDRVYIVREKDSIDGIYRVDAIRPPDITLTYLPLQQVQTLSIGEAP
jgi:hypothetical protein